jgi:hypothetical protein
VWLCIEHRFVLQVTIKLGDNHHQKKFTYWNLGFLSSHALSTNLTPPFERVVDTSNRAQARFPGGLTPLNRLFSSTSRQGQFGCLNFYDCGSTEYLHSCTTMVTICSVKSYIAHGRLICFSTLACVHSSLSFDSSIKVFSFERMFGYAMGKK